MLLKKLQQRHKTIFFLFSNEPVAPQIMDNKFQEGDKNR